VNAPTETGARTLGRVTEDSVATNIALRRESFFRDYPDAVDLTARCTFAFHESIKGSLAAALRSRPDSYARGQGIGKKALTIEDVCELVTSGGSEGRRAVAALLSPILDRLDSGPAPFQPAGEVVADFTTSAATVSAAFMRGDAAYRVLQHLVEVDAKARALRKVLRADSLVRPSPARGNVSRSLLTA